MRLPAEWEKQSGVQLTWPDETTPWYELDKVQECYARIAAAVMEHEQLMIVTASVEGAKKRLAEAADAQGLSIDIDKIHFCECPVNDTWARDTAESRFMVTVARSISMISCSTAGD